VPTPFAADSGFAAEGMRREPAVLSSGEGVLLVRPAAETNRWATPCKSLLLLFYQLNFAIKFEFVKIKICF